MFQSISLFGKTIMLYGPINMFAYLSAVVLLTFHLKEYKSFCTFPVVAKRAFFKEKSKSFLKDWLFVFLEAVSLFLVAFAVISSLIKPVSRLFLGDSSEGFFPIIFFVPPILFLAGILLRLSPLKLIDFTAPLNCLMLIIFKIACYCAGCCYGIELASSPFFNHKTDRHELPIQLIEIACAVIMFIILYYMRKKRKRAGFMFPTFIVMYCGSRFIFEFWRDDYPDVVGGLNGNQIMSLIGLVLGIVYLVVVFVWGVRITAFFDEKNKAFLEKEIAKIEEKKRSQKKSKSKKR